jgi:hypothetical protein
MNLFPVPPDADVHETPLFITNQMDISMFEYGGISGIYEKAQDLHDFLEIGYR